MFQTTNHYMKLQFVDDSTDKKTLTNRKMLKNMIEPTQRGFQHMWNAMGIPILIVLVYTITFFFSPWAKSSPYLGIAPKMGYPNHIFLVPSLGFWYVKIYWAQ